ncbi:MAG: hypothetical protein U9P00_03840 [Pseudomonadota bacterium]|nr:hypothetical protein [Pseudomonadota bacterium]
MASAAGLSGRAEDSLELLDRALQGDPSANAHVRLWVLGVQAEISSRLGRYREAERYYRQAMALDIEDVYLSGAFVDFLLDQGRPQEVLALLKEDTLPDSLLVRVALAEQRLQSPDFARHMQSLRACFAAARRRDDNRHLREEARYTLHLLNQPGEALRLARENWSSQREPADARLVLESSLAASDFDSAREVLSWLEQTRLEDVQLMTLRERLERRQR